MGIAIKYHALLLLANLVPVHRPQAVSNVKTLPVLYHLVSVNQDSLKTLPILINVSVRANY